MDKKNCSALTVMEIACFKWKFYELIAEEAQSNSVIEMHKTDEDYLIPTNG